MTNHKSQITNHKQISIPKISNSKLFEILGIGILNLFGIWILGFGFLLPIGSQAAWSEPSQAPPGGNTAIPVYSTGTGQTIDGTLHVGTPGSYATGLQGTGSTNGIQGNSTANALFGNLATGGAGGNRAVYGLAVDANDYALYSSGGLGLGFTSGDIWFLQQDAGIAWPRESDGQSLYGVYVNAGGELQVRGHGGGINFMSQTATSRLTISEAGATNVVNGPLTVGGTAVCLQTGAGCPSVTTPNLQAVTTSGNSTTNVIAANAGISVDGQTVIDDGAGWHRSYGATGWYNGTYGGGWYMTDGTWIRSYGSKKVYIDQGLRAQTGLSAGGYDPDASHLVSTPTFYTEQGQVGNATGGLKGAGTLNSVQLCIQGDCRSSWAGAAPTPTLQAVTDVGKTTTQPITVATIDTGQGATEAHLMNQNLRTSDSPAFGNLTVSNDIFAVNNKSIRIDANNDTNLIFGNYNGNGGVFTYNGTYDLNLAVEGDVKASQFCFGAADCRTSWTAIGGASGWTDDGANVRLTTVGDNVGIGTTDPAGKKLKVQGLAEITSGLTVGGSISAGGDLNMNTHNILSVGKITVGTVDPVYEISGKKYATFASAIAGGVKEEYVGTVYIKDKSAQKNGEYELAINFDKAEAGSDLWVWRQTVDFNKNSVNVLITPYGAFARTYYLLAGNKIILRSDQPVEAAIRLIGKRFDWRDWPTLLPDQGTAPSFKIK